MQRTKKLLESLPNWFCELGTDFGIAKLEYNLKPRFLSHFVFSTGSRLPAAGSVRTMTRTYFTNTTTPQVKSSALSAGIIVLIWCLPSSLTIYLSVLFNSILTHLALSG